MSLRVSFLFSLFLFSFDFVNSFRDSNLLYTEYESKLTENIDENGKKTIVFMNQYSEICNTITSVWGDICKSVIQRLRQEPAYKNFYMNYLAITTYRGERCSNRKVWVPSLNSFAEQLGLSCFARPAITQKEEEEEETFKYLRDIAIFPWDENAIAVLKYNEADGNYLLLEIMENLFWRDAVGVDENVFITPVPYSYSEIQFLYDILYPELTQLYQSSLSRANIIHSVDTFGFREICNIAYRFAKYGEEIVRIVRSEKKDLNPEDLTAILRTRNSCTEMQVTVSAYTCLTISNEGKMTNKYKIAAGPDSHSIVLLKERDCTDSNTLKCNNVSNTKPVYEIIELINNLFFLYVELYSKNLY